MMNKYKPAPWGYTLPKTIDEIKKFQLDAEKIDKENNEEYQKRNSTLKDFRKFIDSCFGDKSKEAKYINNIRLPSPPDHTNTIDMNIRYIENAQESVNKTAREKEQQEKAELYKQKAVAWLLNKGRILGTDFNLNDAVYKANALKFHELVTDANKSNVPTDCSGCSECDSWVPGEHRCTCGNRRVEWGYDGDFESMYIYPECY